MLPAPAFDPPYFAVIFVNQRREGDSGYGATADRMVELASQQPGYLGIDSVRDATGFGITVSYWRDEASIASWKAVAEHAEAQRRGHAEWYAAFTLHVAKVERAHAGPTARGL
jgi:heme-degrading monooxygenase HmoA